MRRDNGRDNGDKTASYTRFDGGFNAHSETVEILKNHNEFLKGQLEAERGASAELRRIIAGLVQRVPELEAPTTPEARADYVTTVDAEAGSAPHPATEGAQEAPEARSWWRRWFG